MEVREGGCLPQPVCHLCWRKASGLDPALHPACACGQETAPIPLFRRPPRIQVNLAKPLGVKFKRGNDGAAYVSISDPRLGNTDPRIKPGDRVVNVSASFGGDVWEARNFGQVIYAIKTRNGEVYLRLESRGGDIDVFEVSAWQGSR